MPVTVTPEYMFDLAASTGFKCALTDIPFQSRGRKQDGRGHCNPFGMSPDRIDNRKGYEPGNVRYVCNIVNFALNSFPDDVFLTMCRAAVAKADAEP